MTDWKAYFRMLRKKIWLVILIIILFVSAASYIALFVIKPKYEANIKLFIMLYEGDYVSYDNLMASQALVKDYKELITSRAITSDVIHNLNLKGLTDQKMAENIDVELIPNSSMLNVTVQYEDPAVVVDIANEIGNVFIRNMNNLTKMSNISLVDKAVLSENRASMRNNLIIVCSLLIAIIFALGLVYILVCFDDTIGYLEEVEKKTGLKVVGIIPHSKNK